MGTLGIAKKLTEDGISPRYSDVWRTNTISYSVFLYFTTVQQNDAQLKENLSEYESYVKGLTEQIETDLKAGDYVFTPAASYDSATNKVTFSWTNS